MKLTLLAIIATLFISKVNAQSANQAKFVCDAPTDNHPYLTFTANKAVNKGKIIIEQNDGSRQVYNTDMKAKTAVELNNSYLSRTVILVGTGNNSMISGNGDFYSNAVSLVMMQKVDYVQGALTVIMTHNDTVTIHTCSKQ